MDDLSKNLNRGYLENASLNYLRYADDLCLISLSSSGMQQLLNISQTYATNHLLLFNSVNSFLYVLKTTPYKISHLFLP